MKPTSFATIFSPTSFGYSQEESVFRDHMSRKALKITDWMQQPLKPEELPEQLKCFGAQLSCLGGALGSN